MLNILILRNRKKLSFTMPQCFREVCFKVFFLYESKNNRYIEVLLRVSQETGVQYDFTLVRLCAFVAEKAMKTSLECILIFIWLLEGKRKLHFTITILTGVRILLVLLLQHKVKTAWLAFNHWEEFDYSVRLCQTELNANISM